MSELGVNTQRCEDEIITFEFYDFNGIVFFTDPEDLQIAEDGLLCLRVTIYFDAKEVALILPIKFALRHEENKRGTV